MKDIHLFLPPGGSGIVNRRFRLKPNLWVPKTTGCRTKAEAKKVAPGILAELRKEHGIEGPKSEVAESASVTGGTQPKGNSIMEVGKRRLASHIKERHWKSHHIYRSTFKYKRHGFGTAGDLPPKLLPRAAFIKLRDFLLSCKDIENSASGYGRRICGP